MAELPRDAIYHYESDGKNITVTKTELVRCRDCIHRFVDGDNVRYNVCMLNHNKVQPDDWFCADGERKDGAE